MAGRSDHPLKPAAIRAAATWGLDAQRIREDLPISGSPERSEFRCVLECAGGRLVVMENIRAQDRPRKQAIIDRLDFLALRNLAGVHPYLPTVDGRQIIPSNGRLWQAAPYIPGVPLDRPQYAFDAWRGETMAAFLVNLRRASQDMPAHLVTAPFSILRYIDVLFGQIIEREPPELVEKLTPIITFLQHRLANQHDLLPLAFCHGDYHPLNMIWSENTLMGVIDWEFSGSKPENYDAALLIGCLGMEIPDALSGPLVLSFIRTLQTARLLAEASRRTLVEMTIAIRFGWLAEWLRTKDTEMIALETVYMRLLMDHADELEGIWCR